MSVPASPGCQHCDPWGPRGARCGRRSDGSQGGLFYGVEDLRHHHECCDLGIVSTLRVQPLRVRAGGHDAASALTTGHASDVTDAIEAPFDFSDLAETQGGHVLALILSGDSERAQRHIFKLKPPWGGIALELLHSDEPIATLDLALGRLDPEKARRVREVIDRQSPLAAGVERRAALSAVSFSLAEVAGQLGSIDWFWPSWVPLGFVTLIAGKPGIGKSAFALDLVGRYLKGQSLPGGAPTPPAGGTKGVIWVDTEGSQAILVDRATKWKLPFEQIRWPKSTKAPNEEMPLFRIDDPGDMEDLERLIVTQEPGLVVIDSLRGALQGDENSSDVGTPLARLAGLARRYQVPIIVIHHLRKTNQFESQDEVSLDRLRGSSAIGQFARSVIAIDSPDPDDRNRVRVHVIKSNLCKPPEPIGFCFEEHGAQYSDAPTKARNETQMDRAVELLRVLLQKGPMKALEVLEQGKGMTISERTMRSAKKKLGVVDTREGGRHGHSMWAMPAARADAPHQSEASQDTLMS